MPKVKDVKIMKLNLSNRQLIDIDTRILLITDDDLDGVVSGSIIKIHYPQVTWYMNRKEDFISRLIESGEIFNYDIMIMIDRSPKDLNQTHLLLELFNNKLFILDHHESFYRKLNKDGLVDEFDIDLSCCGAMIAAKLFGLEDQPIVKLTNIYDMWKDTDGQFEEAKLLNKKLDFLDKQKFGLRCIEIFKGDRQSLLNDDEIQNFLYMLKTENKYIKDKIKETYVVGDEAIVFCEKWKSEILNGILIKYPDVSVAMAIDISKNSISIRSNKGIALDKAKEIGYNFGGHLNASGVQGDFKNIFHSMLFKGEIKEWAKA